MSRKWVAKQLGVPEATLRDGEAAGRLPAFGTVATHVYWGEALRFRAWRAGGNSTQSFPRVYGEGEARVSTTTWLLEIQVDEGRGGVGETLREAERIGRVLRAGRDGTRVAREIRDAAQDGIERQPCGPVRGPTSEFEADRAEGRRALMAFDNRQRKLDRERFGPKRPQEAPKIENVRKHITREWGKHMAQARIDGRPHLQFAEFDQNYRALHPELVELERIQRETPTSEQRAAKAEFAACERLVQEKAAAIMQAEGCDQHQAKIRVFQRDDALGRRFRSARKEAAR